MKNIIRHTLAIIFSSLAIIHFYWATGGRWGWKNALPTNEEGDLVLSPTTADCIIVGILLMLLAIFYGLSLNSFDSKILITLRKIGIWIVPIIFLLRAIGEFKYAGFFKQIKGTEFANMDTMFFSPLCLLISLMGFLFIKYCE